MPKKKESQLSFYMNGNQVGVRFKRSTGEAITIGFIQRNKDLVIFKQNEFMPPMVAAEFSEIAKIMKQVEKGKHI